MTIRISAIGLCLALATAASGARAADIPGRAIKPTPAPEPSLACKETAGLPTDIFGFATGSDVNDLGSLSGSIEYNGNFGTRFGWAKGHLLKGQLSYSPLPCVEIGPTIQGATVAAAATTLGVNSHQFGGTVEMKYKLLGRSEHGVGLTFTTEPGAFDRTYRSGFADAFGNPFRPSGTLVSNLARVLLDFELVKDRLYGAVNLEHMATWDDAVTPFNGFTNPGYFKSSGFNIRAALAYKLNDSFYLGVEGSHQRAYLGTFLNRELGQAWFAGPTFYWQATEKVSITGSYNYQFAGQTKDAFNLYGVSSKGVDLFNFNRHLAKLKVAYSF